MKLLLDSANLDEVRRFSTTPAIAGVTTNPSLVSKEKKRDYLGLLCEIADVLNSSVYTVAGKVAEKKHLSVEVITLDPKEMLQQADLFSRTLLERRMNIDVHIKIPVMPQTLEVISRLRHEKFVKTNATACMTALQAKIAADAGANVVSFFYNRMIDGFTNGDVTSEHAPRDAARMEISSYIWQHRQPVPYIVGSIRTVSDIEELAADQVENSVNFTTVSAKLLDEALKHPQTDKAIQGFQKDIDAWLR